MQLVKNIFLLIRKRWQQWRIARLQQQRLALAIQLGGALDTLKHAPLRHLTAGQLAKLKDTEAAKAEFARRLYLGKRKAKA